MYEVDADYAADRESKILPTKKKAAGKTAKK